MRQGQQNRRGRGRNNNNNHNRKSQNPLTRSFESTGPDVKLRGTPSHIAEKYVSLARDALSSGDPVLAENYLQHAEHYNRIILTYREQQLSQGGMDPFNGGAARTHSLASHDGNDGDEFGDEETEDAGNQPQAQLAGEGGQPPMQPQQPPFQPQRNFEGQPRFENRPRHENRDHRQQHQRHDRGDNPRFDRGDRGDRGDRQDFRSDRGFRDRNQQQGGDQDGGFRRRDRFGGNQQGQPPAAPDRDFPPQTGNGPPPGMVERPAPQATPQQADQEQPAFLRRPVRRPRREEGEEAAPTRQPATEEQD